jgi:hypothetical protein
VTLPLGQHFPDDRSNAVNDGGAYAVSANGVPPLPEPSMLALPLPPPWSIHLPSYPPMVICRFCFDNSHEAKNHKRDCWKKSDKNKAIAARNEEKMKEPYGSSIYKN